MHGENIYVYDTYKLVGMIRILGAKSDATNRNVTTSHYYCYLFLRVCIRMVWRGELVRFTVNI